MQIFLQTIITNEFIRNIWKTIERYDDHLVEYNLSEKLNADLISEYFELLSNEAIISRLITNPNKSSLYSSYQSSILSPNSQRYSTFSDDNRNSPTSAGPYLRTSRSQTNMKKFCF